MKSASVTFLRVQGAVEMTLFINGKIVARSSSQESIARKLQIQDVNHLTIEDVFSTDLPTTESTLELAGVSGVN